MNLEIKKNKENYEVNVFTSRGSKSSYRNIIDKDVNKLAQVLIDLELYGFPIRRAIHIFNERMNKKDWLGF